MESWLEKYVWSINNDETCAVDDEQLLISKEWLDFLNMTPFLKKKLYSLLCKIQKMRETIIIYPPETSMMAWSYLCSPQDIKVIILGQDPYHRGQATGLAFSVFKNIPIPPSLKNIYSELARTNQNFQVPTHGCLEQWAGQGVLLLNTILTVEKGKAGSHSALGWVWFTNYIISSLSDKLINCVFLLWGSKAIEKASLVDSQRHLVLKAQHPSPLAVRSKNHSLWSPFIGCNHFNQANIYLVQHNRGAVDWSLI